jgi:hypothetical protein
LLTFPNLQQRANFRTAIGDAIVTTAATGFRILAFIPNYRRAAIARQLAPLNASLLFVRHSAEAFAAIREDGPQRLLRKDRPTAWPKNDSATKKGGRNNVSIL